MTVPERSDATNADLIADLRTTFPGIPAQSVVACVLDACEAVEYVQGAQSGRQDMVARLARAHLDELAAFYPATADEQATTRQ